jgi:hypothetical protein
LEDRPGFEIVENTVKSRMTGYFNVGRGWGVSGVLAALSILELSAPSEPLGFGCSLPALDGGPP